MQHPLYIFVRERERASEGAEDSGEASSEGVGRAPKGTVSCRIREGGCEVEIAKLEPDFFLPLALFPIANCDNMRLFCTLREREIISDLGAHLSIPFYCSEPPPQ